MILPDDFMKWPFAERQSWLKANADSVVTDQTVYKELSPEQRDELETDISKASMDLQKTEEEFKEVKKTYKEMLDPIKDGLKTMVKSLRTGLEEVTTDIYYVADYDNGRMYGFAPDGVEVENRRLRSDERQTTVHSIGRSAN